ncbi:MAG: DUF6382 domain-containing protein [Firmicutes bacterium]|nr:DUF6382 domain-containing protein [Bacillota bacterium]
MWENNEFKLAIAENSIYEHERIMLSSGSCSYLLPMDFVGENGKSVAYYSCSGFAPLSSYRIERTDDALFILEKVLLMLNQVVEYLISPARVTLTLDTIFYNIETGEIKIAYVPIAEKKANLKFNMLVLISQLKKELYDGDAAYLDKIAQLIHYNNYEIRDIVNCIGRFRRELYNKNKRTGVN